MTKYTKDDVTLLDVENLYDGFFSLKRYYFKHKLFDGDMSDVVAREVFERGHAVAVLPYDPILDEVVLLEQFRFPAVETTERPWLVEVVAGIVEPGEDLEDVCHREASEEAGIELTHLRKMHTYLASPGACTERIHLYIGKVDATTAKGIHGLDHEAEDIKVMRVSLTQAREWLEQGIIDNSTAVIALQWLLLNKKSVVKQWSVK